MADHPPITTFGVVTFGPSGQDNHELFRVNPDIPLRQALYAALDKNCERRAWASHYLCNMGKAVIDDLCLRQHRLGLQD